MICYFLFDFCLFVDDDEKGKSFVEKFVCVFGEFFGYFLCVFGEPFLDFFCV